MIATDPDRPSRPTRIEVFEQNIPSELRVCDQWVCWRWTWKPDKSKWDKPPFDAKTGQLASSTDAATWSSFADALAAYRDAGNDFDGIGYVLSGGEDDLIGIDLDHVVDPSTGELQPWQSEQRGKRWQANVPDPAEIVAAVGSYTEISPSGTGVRIFTRGKLWPNGRKQGALEVYQDGRYLTVTGHHVASSPTTIVPINGSLEWLRQQFFVLQAKPQKSVTNSQPPISLSATEIIDKARRASNGAKFEALFAGNIAGHPSQSEAELALCSRIAFYAGPDERLIDEVFRQSGLLRDKWDEQHGGGRTYGQMTISKALEGKTEFYQNYVPPATTTAATCRVGPLELVPTNIRRTATKIVVQTEVRRGDQVIDVLKVSDAISSRKDFTKRILAHLGNSDEDRTHEVDATLASLLVAAANTPSQKPVADGPQLQQLLADYVPAQAHLVYRIAQGRAYSELYGELSRSAFIERFTNNEVLRLAAMALDAPRDQDGELLRPALISRVEKELKLLWGDELARLPVLADADIDDKSTTAAEFRAAIIRLWTKPVGMALVKTPIANRNDSVQVATRTSIIGRIQRLIGEDRLTSSWMQVQEGFAAWARLDAAKRREGEIFVHLGMRWELSSQVGILFPSVSNQTALQRLGEKFGVVEPHPEVPGRTDRGATRLVVLTRELTDELMYVPSNEGLSVPDDR